MRKTHFINLNQDVKSITDRMEFIANHRSEILATIIEDFDKKDIQSLTDELRNFVLSNFRDKHSVLTAICLQILVDGILAESIQFEIVKEKN